MASAPLSGVVVVERAGRLAGAVAASLLAELGATVVRFNDPVGRPQSDPMHWHRHPLATQGKTTVTPSGPLEQRDAQWRDLATSADVVILSAPEDCSTTAKIPLTCIFTALGLVGAQPDDNCDELRLQALTGVMAVTGEAGQPPQHVATPILEIIAGINGATSAIAALRAGAPTGTVLDLAVYDSGVALLGTFHSSVFESPDRQFRDGCRHPLLAPWNSYPTADGAIVLCSTTDEHWQRLLDLMECSALRQDARFIDTNTRVKNIEAVDALVTAWTTQRTTADAISAVSGAGIPVGPVATIPEMIARENKAGRIRELISEDDQVVVCPVPLLEFEPNTSERARRALPEPGSPVRPPCAGLRVIEIGPYTAGPLAGRLLADLGAEVIKIEPVGGEVSRRWLPSFGGISGYFANYNAGKRSIVLDFHTLPGAAALWELLKDADLVIQNLSPGALNRAGFGHEAVIARYPNIVYCSISGYGDTSAPRPAVDTVIQAASGIMTQVGDRRAGQNIPCIKVGISIADLVAAHIASLATLASLGLGTTHDKGRYIDLSMLQGLAWMTQLAWPDGDSRFPEVTTISCNDGFVVAHCTSSALGTLALASKSREEIGAELRALEISSSPVNELHEVLTSALTEKRGLVQWKSCGGKDIPILSSPHRWSAAVPPVGKYMEEAGCDGHPVIAVQQQPARKG